MLLTAIQSAAGEGTPATAKFLAAKTQFDGSMDHEDSPLYSILAAQGEGNFTWTLAADDVTVNVTRQERIEATRPTNPSERLGTISTGPEEYSNHHFSDATANATSRTRNSYLWAPMAHGSWGHVLETDGKLSLTPGPAPESAELIERQGTENPIPTNATWASGTGTIRVQGNFSLKLWDMNVTVQNATKTSWFTSGNWTEPLDPNPSGQDSVRKRYDQTVRLDVKGALLEIRANGRPITAAAIEFAMAGKVEANFFDVQGSTHYANGDAQLETSVLSIRGKIRVLTWNPTANGTLLRNELTTAPELLGLEPVPQPETPQISVAKPQKFSWPVTFALMPLTLVGCGIFLVALRRSRPPQLDDVEWALFEQNSKRAVSIGRRLVRRNPRDSTAVFLYGTALLVQNQASAVLRRVEPLALRLDKKGRIGVAYVLARAASALGDSKRLTRWAVEAAVEPALRAQMLREGTWPPPAS